LAELVPLGDCCELEPLLNCLGKYSSHSTEIYAVIKRMGDAARQQLKSRLRSKDKRVREVAVGALVQFHDGMAQRLLSIKLNGRSPWLDPATPISRRRVFQCARQLPFTEDNLRARYRILAEEFGLKIRF